MCEMWAGSFLDDVLEKRIAVLCPLSPKQPILLDVIQVDESVGMMKVKTVMSDGTESREWWLSLGSVVTVAVIPKEEPLVQPIPSGIVLT